jgi:hypothetical protein
MISFLVKNLGLMAKISKHENIICKKKHYKIVTGLHLVLNLPGFKWGARKTLCGQEAATAASMEEDDDNNNGSNNVFERPATSLTINDIVRADANGDDKEELCDGCLGEFFDNVLPLSWELINREAEAARKRTICIEWKN